MGGRAEKKCVEKGRLIASLVDVNFSGHCGDGGSGGKEVWVEKGQQLIAGWLIGPLHPRG